MILNKIMQGYVEVHYDSSNIYKSEYHFSTKSLYIYFHKGGVYKYDNVPYDVYREFETTDSQGKMFHIKIKNAYNHTKMFEQHKAEKDEVQDVIDESKTDKTSSKESIDEANQIEGDYVKDR